MIKFEVLFNSFSICYLLRNKTKKQQFRTPLKGESTNTSWIEKTTQMLSKHKKKLDGLSKVRDLQHDAVQR